MCFHLVSFLIEVQISFPNDYNDKIKQSVDHLGLQLLNSVAVHNVPVKGTSYKKGMCVVLEKNDEGLVFGKIELILVCNSCVYFVTEKCQSDFLFDQGIYCPKMGSENPISNYFCLHHARLLDYYPLPVYNMFGLSLIALHHSFPPECLI